MTALDIIKLIILVICLPSTALMVWRLFKNLRRFRAADFEVRYLSTEEAPSVSVCIPVRNEDHAIRDCLERVLASTYPKMEVIVLDDDSVDNTDEVVKIFARSGVRFIKGKELPEGWIGKNKAMDQLASQASGQYILFLSADTDIKPDSISRLVSHAVRHKLDMIGVMPIRLDGQRLSAIFATMRYFWPLAFGKTNSPASSTAAWLVRRQALADNGGFAKYKSAVMPESRLAEDFAQKKTYQFVISDEQLGFSYEKRWSSQIDTAIRTLWPVNVRSGSGVLGALLIPPLIWSVLTIDFLTQSSIVVDILLTIVALGFPIAYVRFAFVAWRKTSWLSLVIWPFILLQEIFCLSASFWRHQSHSLVWKGRTLTDHID